VEGCELATDTAKGNWTKNAEKLEQGEEPTGKIRSILEQAGAFETMRKETVTTWGLRNSRRKLEMVPQREYHLIVLRLVSMFVLAGKVLKMPSERNLREVIESQGRVYDVREPGV